MGGVNFYFRVYQVVFLGALLFLRYLLMIGWSQMSLNIERDVKLKKIYLMTQTVKFLYVSYAIRTLRNPI